jgi:hypothetical protein
MQWCLDMPRPDTQRQDMQWYLDTPRPDTERLVMQWCLDMPRPDTRLDTQRPDMQQPDMRGSPDMLKCRELNSRLRHRDILRQRTTELRTCTCHRPALVIIHKKWFQARTRSSFPDFQRDLLHTPCRR